MTVISMDSLHTEELREALQKNLRKFRTAAGFSQEELSQLLGMNRATYTYYETGKTTPSVVDLYVLARIYNKRMEDFFQKKRRGVKTSPFPFSYFSTSTRAVMSSSWPSLRRFLASSVTRWASRLGFSSSSQ